MPKKKQSKVASKQLPSPTRPHTRSNSQVQMNEDQTRLSRPSPGSRPVTSDRMFKDIVTSKPCPSTTGTSAKVSSITLLESQSMKPSPPRKHQDFDTPRSSRESSPTSRKVHRESPTLGHDTWKTVTYSKKPSSEHQSSSRSCSPSTKNKSLSNRASSPSPTRSTPGSIRSSSSRNSSSSNRKPKRNLEKEIDDINENMNRKFATLMDYLEQRSRPASVILVKSTRSKSVSSNDIESDTSKV